jgi:pimeloyl-ACP methyl ester carboxylesterase
MLASLDLRDAVRSLDVPTTVIAGTADRLAPPKHARSLAAALPQLTQLIELDGVGHMAPIEAADVVTDAIRGMVADHLGPTG